jgi:hypothetical protein
MKRLTTIIITSLFIITTLAQADYHYASHSGSNTYPYASWETAAEIIDSAIYAASPHDTIFIAAGDYEQIVYQRAQDTCLTFIGAGPDSTRIWTNQNVQLWFARDKTVAENIWFQHYAGQICYGIISTNSSITARYCRFTGGAHLSGGIMGAGDSTKAEFCFFDNLDDAVDANLYTRKLIFRNNMFRSSISGVILEGDWSVGEIENNIFIQTAPHADLLFSEPTNRTDSLLFLNNYIDNIYAGHNIYAPFNADVSNNTVRRIYQNPYPQLNYGFYTILQRMDSLNINFRNNALTESGTGIKAEIDYFPHNHIGVEYNDFWGNVFSNISVDHWVNIDTIGNINACPMYAGPDSFDVHLQAYSPLIDAGDPSILDVDGTRSDIGVFGGPGGASYQYQDLPPRKPDSLAYILSDDSLIIRWRMNNEIDFWRYIINRDTISGFIPWAGNIAAEPNTNVFIDFNWNRFHNYYYRIAAYDNQGNLSPYSDELRVINVGIEDNSGVEAPSITTIESNYPNPFNSSTTIIYSVANLGPIPAQINIDIYDIQGRKVRNLINNREEIGKHTVIWDGRDDSGNELASGIYFARITQWDVDYLSKSQKLVLVR